MSELTQNTLITEIDEVAFYMNMFSAPKTQKRLCHSLALNNLNSKFEPYDVLNKPFMMYEDENIVVYTAQTLEVDKIEKEVQKVCEPYTTTSVTEDITDIMNLVGKTFVIRETGMDFQNFHYANFFVWTKDFLEL